MRLLFISLFISTLCFGQNGSLATNDKRIGQNAIKIDSLDEKTISIKELESYLTRISIVAMKQFDLTEKAKYDNIFKELQAIYTEADKKRKQK